MPASIHPSLADEFTEQERTEIERKALAAGLTPGDYIKSIALEGPSLKPKEPEVRIVGHVTLATTPELRGMEIARTGGEYISIKVSSDAAKHYKRQAEAAGCTTVAEWVMRKGLDTLKGKGGAE